MIGWIQALWHQIRSIPLPLVALALGLLTAQTALVALSWRNVLRVAYPATRIRYREILSYYAGGVGINAVLPASAGTLVMLGLFRVSIEGSTVAGLVGAAVAENLFFVAVGAAIYLWLFLTVANSFDASIRLVGEHAWATVAIAAVAAVVIAVLVRLAWRRLRGTWEHARGGGIVLAHPRIYFPQVAGIQLVSYLARMGVNATLMSAFGIPVSIRSIFLIAAASSVSSTIAVTPGGLGAQTALTSVVLAGVAPAGTIAAYAVGQQLIITAWNVVFGAVLLIPAIGWRGAQHIVQTRGQSLSVDDGG
jgi:uncharacterized membrane protein YbhN (UPF0104 family)